MCWLMNEISSYLIIFVAKCLFVDAGSIPVLNSGLGSPANRSIILDNVVCSGRESKLTECEYSTTNNCDRSEEAGVRCEGEMKVDVETIILATCLPS